MAHFAIIAPPLSGHYIPLSNLASELIQRGHRVTFVHRPEARQLITAPGAEFAAIGSADPPLSAWIAPMAKIRATLGLGSTFAGMIRFLDMFAREAPELLQRLGVDALLVDQLEPGGSLVAEHLDLPFASIGCTIPINREEGIPPPYLGWSYAPGPEARSRNRGGWRVADFLLRKLGDAIERNCRLLGLPPRRRLDDCLSPTLQLSQLVAGLDFPREELPDNFHYSGPFRRDRQPDLELPGREDRPLAYCTLGTLQGSRFRLFRKIAEAADRSGLQLVITRGRAEWPRNLRLIGDPLVHDWVPQEAVLRAAQLAICHGGMNAVLDAAAAGVPMLVLPLAFEQSAVAARVVHAGIGESLPARSSAAKIANALRALQLDATYGARAAALREEISSAGGSARAADLIEQWIAPGAPKEGATTARGARGDARGGSRNGSSSAATRSS